MFNCKPDFIVSRTFSLHCLFPKENFYIIHSNINPSPVENSSLSTTHCLGYTKFVDTPGNLSRCTSCNINHELEILDNTYNCKSCSISLKQHCKMVLFHNNRCICGRCMLDTYPNTL